MHQIAHRALLGIAFLGCLAWPACERAYDPAAASQPPGDRQPPENRGKRTLVIAHPLTEGRSRELMDAMERDFEARRPGVDVRQIVMADDDYEKFGLLNLFSGNSTPDIFFEWSGYLVERDAQAGFSRELASFLDRDAFRGNFYPDCWHGASWAGNIHLLPLRMDISVVIFYNREIFQKFSLRIPADWMELEAACDRLRAGGVTPIVAGNKDLWMAGNWAGHLASRVVGEDEYHAALSLKAGHPFDAPGWHRALELLGGLVRRRAFNAGAVSMTDDEAKAEFIAGRAAMIPSGDWLVLDLTKAIEEGRRLSYGVFNTPPIPDGRGDQGSIIGVSSGLCMGRQSRDPELSWEFLKEFFQPERQKSWVEEGTISPVAGARSAAAKLPALEELQKLISGAPRMVSPPDTGYAPAAWQAFYDAVQQVLAGNRSPREALAEAERFVAVFQPRR